MSPSALKAKPRIAAPPKSEVPSEASNALATIWRPANWMTAIATTMMIVMRTSGPQLSLYLLQA